MISNPQDIEHRNPCSPLSPVLPASGRLSWTRLAGDSLSLAIASAAQDQRGLLVVITPDMQTADRLSDQLGFFLDGSDVTRHLFPDWETLPYDVFSPHQDIISGRLATLYHLTEIQHGVLIIPVSTLMQRLPPREFLYCNSLIMRVGERLDLESMRERLDTAGYRCVSQVMEHGEFAVRGSLLDLFPMGSPAPCRIDLFDDEIDSIRTFDVETQRSMQASRDINLLPAREFPLHTDAIRLFRQQFRARFEGDPQLSAIYRDVSEGIAPGGIEYYLPLFFAHTETFFDYMPEVATFIMLDAVSDAAETFHQQVSERYEARRHDRERPLLTPAELFLDSEAIQQHAGRYPLVQLETFQRPEQQDNVICYDSSLPANLRIRQRSEQPAQALQQFLQGYPGRVLFTAESAGRRETLADQLRGFGIRAGVVDSWQTFLGSDDGPGLTVAPLEQGFVIHDPALTLITETSLFGEHARQSRRRKPGRDPASIIRSLADLEVGAPVVHEQHGVGRFLGLETLSVHDIKSEYLTLEYSGGDKLYVPVAALQLISRYTGAAPENAPLHKLGGDQWQRARKKAARRVNDVAAELLDVYARRAARKGHACASPQDEYAAFASSFPFEETPDQESSIASVLTDMQTDTPMDRVVCGDVGFGKTEVAMRAAFLATQDGRQVALLVPTTLLAQQHYQNFCDRFSEWPLRIEVLSRFRTGKQQDAVLEGIADGKVDIVIGTHKLLQDSVRFKRLGLLIIDEEHRFGVRQKEKLKSLRSEVDILTLTATPIPRTLNMSLSGLRDLSIISTPPPNRLAVKTFISEWNDATIQEACQREIKRGGQVYFLHNEVESIERVAADLEKIIPEASIRVAHGQLRERELEYIMMDFYHRRFNLLVCTTIIESGIDIPTANTIIMNRADKLGLAQLHQLRGRVGRSHHRAYAYLLVPARRAMTADAVKRLQAIEAMDELGAGFTLSTHDLEIRGAGELLGDDQSGQIHEIGFSLYTDLLERAVRALREGRRPELEKPLHQGPEIDCLVAALIPDDYIPDVHTRLVMYKRIAGAASTAELRELQVEMIDRFGLLPEPLKNLFRITAIKLEAEPMGVTKIEIGPQDGRILFGDNPDINTQKLVELIQLHPQRYRFEGGNKLRLTGDFEEEESRFRTITDILSLLSPGTGAHEEKVSLHA
ncbi:MAG: transcription-repair coupling factor [Pseudomonadota bacterium]